MSTAKYEGPHSDFDSTCDGEIHRFYENPEIEHVEYAPNNKGKLDFKFVHPKGWVRYWLHGLTREEAGYYTFGLNDDVWTRIKHNNKHVHFEYRGEKQTLANEIDFGTQAVADNKLFINPYIRWQSMKDFTANSLRFGGVFRYSDFMLRAQMRVNNLFDSENRE
jgi:hypothetical protein